jgi:hypothetical protein
MRAPQSTFQRREARVCRPASTKEPEEAGSGAKNGRFRIRPARAQKAQGLSPAPAALKM